MRFNPPSKLLQALIICVGIVLPSTQIAAAEKQLVAGAGPSTNIVTTFFEHFSHTDAAKNYMFEIPQRSVKHAGGIEASDKYIFGRTGRPLNAAELKKNKREIFLARIPLAFVAGGGVTVQQLKKDQLIDILSGKIKNWKDVGGSNADIILVGREKTEASLTVFRKFLPNIDDAVFSEIFTRDHRVVNYMKSPKANFALAFGAKANFKGMNIIHIEGLEAGVEVGLVYDIKNKKNSLVKAVKDFVGSKEWRVAISEMGLLPPL